MNPTIGRIVHYKLSDWDREQIVVRAERPGVNANEPRVGDVYPAIVVRVFGGEQCNLQVFCDGDLTHWASSRAQGDEPGQWTWPRHA